mmetsp:Transcript_111313/g.355137  ORF Transcript_111313/g.355137 Transcript_111313/m.355137 type:complete len:318 (+) Transcript_111313:795-1748(+)
MCIGRPHVQHGRSLQAHDVSARETAARHDVRAHALRHEGSLLDAHDLREALGVGNDIAELDLERGLKDPGEERQVVALGLELEGHEVAAEDQQPAPLDRDGHGLPLQVGARVQRQLAALAVDHVEEAQPPAPQELYMPPDHVVPLDVVVVQRLRRQGVLLSAASEGHPGHGFRPAKGLKAHAVPRHGAHHAEELRDVLVVALQVARRGPLEHGLLDAREEEGVHVGDLPLASPPQEVRQQLLLRHLVVAPPCRRHGLLAHLRALEGLNDAPALREQRVVDARTEVEEGRPLVRPPDIEATLSRRGRLIGHQMLLSDV